MMTLLVLPTAWGLRHASPFSSKGEALMRLSGLPFEMKRAMPNKGPKGKLPALRDGDRLIGDSALIQQHLETVHGVDFDGALTAEQRADTLAYRALAEERLYFALVHLRWMNEPQAVQEAFFREAPSIVRPAIFKVIQRQIRRDLRGQGMGRHADAEIIAFAIADFDAIETKLDDKAFFHGDQPTSIDACLFGYVDGVSFSPFTNPLVEHVRARPRLLAYAERCRERFYPAADDAA